MHVHVCLGAPLDGINKYLYVFLSSCNNQIEFVSYLPFARNILQLTKAYAMVAGPRDEGGVRRMDEEDGGEEKQNQQLGTSEYVWQWSRDPEI